MKPGGLVTVVNIEVPTPLEDHAREVIEIDLLRPRWMRKAACRGQGFDAWFPADEDGGGAAAARRVCAGCPVQPECLDYALGAHIRHGLWGGLFGRERTALTRQRGREVGGGTGVRYARGR
jgi:WhiB family redox-sensing transcriptional regulator